MTMNRNAESEKRWVAMTSLWAAVGITAFKIAVGLATSSLGILAEAAHSGLDLAAAAMTYFAVRVAGKPADSTHPYGHGKVENISALFETLLLLITCVWILYGAIRRLAFFEVEVEVTFWSFAVMVTSIAVDASRSRALLKAARKHNSQALEADALHFRTDIWSSLAVLAGLACVLIGKRWARVEFLSHADSVAAIAVALIVLWVSIDMGWRSIRALIDTAPAGMDDRIRQVVESLPGVSDCHNIRVRASGPQIFIDVHVLVDGVQSLTQAHELTERIEEAIQAISPAADVTVHPEPRASQEPVR
jgi:cation diffusion facilitator family transporter